MSENFSLTEKILAAGYYVPKSVWTLGIPELISNSNSSWIYLCDRTERLIKEEGKRGVLCDWQKPTFIRLGQVFPPFNSWLMKRALRDWPIEFEEEPITSRNPDISFILGHRGKTRLPSLLTALKTVAAQQDVSVECIVVEQAMCSEARESLPSWVRYIYTPLPHPDMPYCRSWAFNVGARTAQGQLLVFHDSDVCVPIHYAKELLNLHVKGYQAMRLQRFIFYLDAYTSKSVIDDNCIPVNVCPNQILQNSEGLTIAVDRNIYFQLGGHDEAFVGWGWEDNEFFERCRTTNFYENMYLPIVHLYHTPSPDIGSRHEHKNADFFKARSSIPPEKRAAELSARDFGNPDQLDPPYLPIEMMD